MQIGAVRAVLALGVLHLTMSISVAGPSFNSNRKELANLSHRAGAALHQGLAAFHSMLKYLEQVNPKDAMQNRLDALRSLDSALGDLRLIAERAPKQKLLTKPSTKDEARAIDSLRQALETRKIKFPETEQDLALLAIQLVSGFRKALDAVERFDEKSVQAYSYFENLFQEEGFLLNVGVFCSVIWEMQLSTSPQKAAAFKNQ